MLLYEWEAFLLHSKQGAHAWANGQLLGNWQVPSKWVRRWQVPTIEMHRAREPAANSWPLSGFLVLHAASRCTGIIKLVLELLTAFPDPARSELACLNAQAEYLASGAG